MFEEFLQPQVPIADTDVRTTVHVMWPTYMETIPLTQDLGGWVPDSLHQELAAEGIRGFTAFKEKILPRLPEGHPARIKAEERTAGALNNGFSEWQSALYEAGGNVDAAIQDEPVEVKGTATTWPELEELPAFQKLQRLVDKLSRRYLARTGLQQEAVDNLKFSIFTQVAVQGPGEYDVPHVHSGQFHAGLFYAQGGPAGSKHRFSDPRGHSPPYGKSHIASPKAGQLIFFPPWLSHHSLIDSPEVVNDAEEQPRVVFSFNIGPAEGPLASHEQWSDPTSGMRFMRDLPFNPKDHGL